MNDDFPRVKDLRDETVDALRRVNREQADTIDELRSTLSRATAFADDPDEQPAQAMPMPRRGLLAIPLLLALLGAGASAPDDPVTVRTTVSAATGLLRALVDGRPMAGPDVAPLIAELTRVLEGAR